MQIDQALCARTRRWQPTPTLIASAAVHAGAIGAVVVAPPVWPWAVGALVANHLLLAAAGLAPRSRLLGPNLTRLPRAAEARAEIAITFDDGPDPEVTPRVLDLLDTHQAKATFFCVGKRVLDHPALVREIAQRGHAVENHSHSHSTSFGWFGPSRLVRDLAAGQAAIADATGMAPAFFRAPFGMRSPLLEPALARLGLSLVSWTRRGFDTVDGNAQRVAARLSRGLSAGDVVVLHDGIAVGRQRDPHVVLAALAHFLAFSTPRKLRAVTLRSACVGHHV